LYGGVRSVRARAGFHLAQRWLIREVRDSLDGIETSKIGGCTGVTRMGAVPFRLSLCGPGFLVRAFVGVADL
jgi:hypothetical protein